MANFGQTIFRFCGALVLGAGATLVDHPPDWMTRGPKRIETVPVVAVTREAPVSSRHRFEVKITPGKRAFAIRVSPSPSLDLVRPNSRVDIMVVVDDPRRPATRVAKLFMENMRLLAIGFGGDRGADALPVNAGVATIEVTPREAEALATAASQGSLQLVHRGYPNPNSIEHGPAVSVPAPPPLWRSP